MLMFTKQKLGDDGAEALNQKYDGTTRQRVVEASNLNRAEESLSNDKTVTETDQYSHTETSSRTAA